MHGPINRHQFNRHIADFEKNGLCYLISSRKNKPCLCYLISEKVPLFGTIYGLNMVIFSSADKVWVINLLSRFKIPVYTLRTVLFTENSIILGVFDRKKHFSKFFNLTDIWELTDIPSKRAKTEVSVNWTMYCS